MTPTPDRELAEARACIDRGDENGALKHLDRARRGYVKQHDVAGLEHLFVLADVLDAANERLRDSRENLVYAIGQNIRAETRRAAQLSGKPWQDPYPDLQAPTSHTRISLTRGVKIAIGLGVALTTAAIVGFFALPAFVDVEQEATPVTLRLVNDTKQRAVVADCLFPDCSVRLSRKSVGAWPEAREDRVLGRPHRRLQRQAARQGGVPAGARSGRLQARRLRSRADPGGQALPGDAVPGNRRRPEGGAVARAVRS